MRTHIYVLTNWGGVLVRNGDIPAAVERAVEDALRLLVNSGPHAREELEIVSVSPFFHGDLLHATLVVRKKGE